MTSASLRSALEEAEVRCPKCGGKPSWGYGFAAGVLGSYSMCQGCYAVLHVTADTEGLNEEDAAAANAAAERISEETWKPNLP